MRRHLLLFPAALFCACTRAPVSYAPPPQRDFSAAGVSSYSYMIEMNGPDAPLHFVRDISPDLQGGSWRWTQQEPTLKILLLTTKDLKYSADFTLWDQAMRQTGPVQISFLVNGRTLGSNRYATPGYKHFEKPVPPEWLRTDTETVLAARIDKLYVAEQDQARFGFILSRLGLSR